MVARLLRTKSRFCSDSMQFHGFSVVAGGISAQYFIEVVPTDIQTFMSQINTYQYSVKENIRPIGMSFHLAQKHDVKHTDCLTNKSIFPQIMEKARMAFRDCTSNTMWPH